MLSQLAAHPAVREGMRPAGAVTLLLALAFAAPAGAATVRTVADCSIYLGPCTDDAWFEAAPGEANRLTITSPALGVFEYRD